MATNEQASPEGGRLLLLISLLALAVSAAVGFGRVFQGHTVQFKLAAAAAGATLLAAALERRHVLVSLAVSVAGLAVAVGLLAFPDTTWFGLPTASTFRDALEAMRVVGRTAQIQVAPTLPLPPLFVAALLAVWSGAFASHALASRARSPFLALLPPASLLAFANLVMEDGARPVYVLIFLATAIAVLFADALRRVTQWGPLSMWRPPFEPPNRGAAARLWASTHPRLSATGRSARRLAAATLATAIVGAWILPGFHSDGILRLDGDPEARRVSIDPIVDIKPALLAQDPVELFTVSSTRGSYWRFLSLDRFDGERWTSSNLQAAGAPTVENGLPLGFPPSIDLTVTAPATTGVTQLFQIQKLSQPWLPAAADPIQLTASGPVRYDPAGGVLFAPNGTYEGFSYRVTSNQVVPAPEDLDALEVIEVADPGQYVTLPFDTPREIFGIAHQWSDPLPTTYRKILAIQEHLRGFRYDLNVPAGHDSDHLVNFLTTIRAGYCEQFAGAMAVLLRALGIPARVVVGFTPGRLGSAGGDVASRRYHVGLQNAHAWVEVLFPGYGWLPFEPTPTINNPTAAPYTEPVIPFAQCTEAECTLPGSPGGNQPGEQAPSERENQLDRLENRFFEQLPAPGSADPAGAGATEDGPFPAWTVFALILLVGLLVAAVPVAKLARRRLALARAHDSGQRILAAFEIMALQASDLGLGRGSSETMYEYRARLKQRVSTLDGDLDQLTRLASAAAYSPERLSARDADVAAASARRVAGDIRRAAGPGQRLVGWFRPQGLGRRA
jgi:hypothetical protein